MLLARPHSVSTIILKVLQIVKWFEVAIGVEMHEGGKTALRQESAWTGGAVSSVPCSGEEVAATAAVL